MSATALNQSFDREVIRAAVEGVEEGLESIRRKLTPRNKAELVVAALDLVQADADTPRAAAYFHVRSTVRDQSDDAAGEAALRRLFEIAHGDTGQCKRVAAFLLGLYNGTRFKFDLTDLRCLDTKIHEDCLAVLRLDHPCKQEVHRYFPNGGEAFERLAESWGFNSQGDTSNV